MIANYTDADRLTQLKTLLQELADAIDKGPGARDLAQLAKQYRDTLREIETLEAHEESADPIANILAARWRKANTPADVEKTTGARGAGGEE